MIVSEKTIERVGVEERKASTENILIRMEILGFDLDIEHFLARVFEHDRFSHKWVESERKRGKKTKRKSVISNSKGEKSSSKKRLIIETLLLWAFSSLIVSTLLHTIAPKMGNEKRVREVMEREKG